MHNTEMTLTGMLCKRKTRKKEAPTLGSESRIQALAAPWQAPDTCLELLSMRQIRRVRHWLVEIAQQPSRALARAGVMGGSMPDQDFFSSPTPVPVL